MKRITIFIFVVILSFWATSSFAGNVYFSGSGGYTILLDADYKMEVDVDARFYRYATGNGSGNGKGSTPINSHNFELGLKYSF